MREKLLGSWVFALLVACYHPEHVECALRCGPAPARLCPQGTTCGSDDYCHKDGMVSSCGAGAGAGGSGSDGSAAGGSVGDAAGGTGSGAAGGADAAAPGDDAAAVDAAPPG